MKKSLILTGSALVIATAAALIIPSPGPKVELQGNVQPDAALVSTVQESDSTVTPVVTPPADDPVPVDPAPTTRPVATVAPAPSQAPVASVAPAPTPTPIGTRTCDANGHCSIYIGPDDQPDKGICVNHPIKGRICTINQ